MCIFTFVLKLYKLSFSELEIKKLCTFFNCRVSATSPHLHMEFCRHSLMAFRPLCSTNVGYLTVRHHQSERELQKSEPKKVGSFIIWMLHKHLNSLLKLDVSLQDS